jgi:hypothetical protein
MTITPVEKTFTVRKHTQYLFRDEAEQKIRLPAAPYMALRIRRVRE